ncbi:MAG: peptidoglycan DD-metalloendopeptidase family protein [Rhodanobacteraceae bacterium]|nr:peptidoglycan DD-metalloendopeptidase family protein [Rhodanobacteraceae bacterium]
MERYSLIRASLVGATMLLASCASTGPAPVEERDLGAPARAPAPTARSVPAGGSHRVQRGDTLYSIAFRNGLDYRDLASWNGIGPPYTIYVGQELRLGPARASAAASAPARAGAAAGTAKPLAAAGAPKAPVFEPVEATPPAPPPDASASPSTVAAATPAASAPAPAPTVAPKPPTPPPAASPAAVAAGDVAWRWPADGVVVTGYVAGDQTRQGIDIAGKAGDPVRAAADGSVVYSGNGLIGYGELIIVKHNASLLSAYGHNRKRLVKEGDRVSAGQVIAEMGASSASRDSLHFEIRRNGKPANPLDYLPRR